MSALAEMSYGPYIAAAYAVFFVVLAWDGLVPWLRHRRLKREIQARARRETARATR